MARKTSTEEVLPEAQPTILQPSNITEAEDPSKIAEKNITLGYGEVLLISLDSFGQETGTPFKVSAGTYSKYYSDETKFRLKKNHD